MNTTKKTSNIKHTTKKTSNIKHTTKKTSNTKDTIHRDGPINMQTIQKIRDIKFKKCIKLFCQDAQIRTMKSTFQSYESRLTYLQSSFLARVHMSQLTEAVVTKWIHWLKNHRTVHHISRKHFCHELRLLSVILNWYKNFIDNSFQMPITKKHQQMCFFKPHESRRPDYFIPIKQAKKWVRWLRKRHHNPVYGQLAVFMLLTGVRVGEASGLTWDDIDLNEGKARIVRRVRWDKITKRPALEQVTKTAQSARVLFLSKTLRDMLVRMKKKAVMPPIKRICFM